MAILSGDQRTHLTDALNAITDALMADNRDDADFNYDALIDFATYSLMEVHVACGCVCDPQTGAWKRGG